MRGHLCTTKQSDNPGVGVGISTWETEKKTFEQNFVIVNDKNIILSLEFSMYRTQYQVTKGKAFSFSLLVFSLFSSYLSFLVCLF